MTKIIQRLSRRVYEQPEMPSQLVHFVQKQPVLLIFQGPQKERLQRCGSRHQR